MPARTKCLSMVAVAICALPLCVPLTPATAADAKPAEATPAAKSGTPATVVDDRDAGGILGRNVRSRTGEDMGRVVDIIVTRNGQVRAAIIDFGGFLGVGSRKVAVSWSALRFPAVGQLDPVTVELTRDQVRLAPAFIEGEPIVVLGSPVPANGASPR